MVAIVLANEAINGATVDSRGATAAFEVKDEIGAMDESAVAAREGAADIPRLVDGRLKMLLIRGRRKKKCRVKNHGGYGKGIIRAMQYRIKPYFLVIRFEESR